MWNIPLKARQKAFLSTLCRLIVFLQDFNWPSKILTFSSLMSCDLCSTLLKKHKIAWRKICRLLVNKPNQTKHLFVVIIFSGSHFFETVCPHWFCMHNLICRIGFEVVLIDQNGVKFPLPIHWCHGAPGHLCATSFCINSFATWNPWKVPSLMNVWY